MRPAISPAPAPDQDTRLHPGLEEALARDRPILADLDGCLIAGSTALPGARELLARAGERLVVVSNNSTDTATALSRRLARLGLRIPPERLVLAGETAVEAAFARHPGGRILVVGSPHMIRACRRIGLRPVGADAHPVDAVLLCRAPAASIRVLQRVVDHAAQGVPVIVANPDLTHPGRRSAPIIETGALAELVRACAGEVEMTVVGKPRPALFRRALALLGGDAADALMVGDNPETDGRGARSLGLEVVLLPPGLGPAAREDGAKPAPPRPAAPVLVARQ